MLQRNITRQSPISEPGTVDAKNPKEESPRRGDQPDEVHLMSGVFRCSRFYCSRLSHRTDLEAA